MTEAALNYEIYIYEHTGLSLADFSKLMALLEKIHRVTDEKGWKEIDRYNGIKRASTKGDLCPFVMTSGTFFLNTHDFKKLRADLDKVLPEIDEFVKNLNE